MDASIPAGFVPHRSHELGSMTDVMLAYLSAVTSVEYSRFTRYLRSHPARHNKEQARLLPAYALGEWAMGLIDPEVYRGLESGAKERLTEWAMAMAELNTVFLEKSVSDPEKFLVDKGLITADDSGFGWDPVISKVEGVLKVSLKSPSP